MKLVYRYERHEIFHGKAPEGSQCCMCKGEPNIKHTRDQVLDLPSETYFYCISCIIEKFGDESQDPLRVHEYDMFLKYIKAHGNMVIQLYEWKNFFIEGKDDRRQY